MMASLPTTKYVAGASTTVVSLAEGRTILLPFRNQSTLWVLHTACCVPCVLPVARGPPPHTAKIPQTSSRISVRRLTRTERYREREEHKHLPHHRSVLLARRVCLLFLLRPCCRPGKRVQLSCPRPPGSLPLMLDLLSGLRGVSSSWAEMSDWSGHYRRRGGCGGQGGRGGIGQLCPR